MKIKLNLGIRFDIANINSLGQKLNEGYVKPDLRGMSGLKTLDKYKDQDKDIKKIISLYMELVAKDVKDVNKMVDYYIKTDETISQKPNMCTTKPTSKLQSPYSFAGGGGAGGGGKRF